jgi:catechol 2,3-dioxygenase-like lactoylglutathione lyase family enzyme
MQILGLHHITAIASDPRRNLAFYTDVLGLRLVKRTVNFDDPRTYHFYYGDRVGTPGSILTFFPWGSLPRGRAGTGQASAIAFSVGPEALTFWEDRLHAHGVATSARLRASANRCSRLPTPTASCSNWWRPASPTGGHRGSTPTFPWNTPSVDFTP